MGDRQGFFTLGRNRFAKEKNSMKSGLPSKNAYVSVPSLAPSSANVKKLDRCVTSAASVSTLNRADSWICISKTKSHLDILQRAAAPFKFNLSSKSSRRRSRSVTDMATYANDEEIISTNLFASTQVVDNTAEVSKAKQMTIGRKKFNIDPKIGIEFLIENGLLSHTSTEIAQFLYTGEGLNKSQIGNYLGENREFNLQVLQDFINLQDFTDLSLLQALRQFLWSFHPPGESQKIERMLEGFALRYCQQNSNAFKEVNGCFTLAFCIVILNTLLHNVNVKEKPPLKIFIDMVNGEQTLPVPMLEKIYEEVKLHPFKKDDGDDLMHTFFNPDREGWLWKQGGRYKSWKRRWFIMTGNCLYYFEFTTDKVFRGNVPLENIKVRDAVDRWMPNCFEIFSDSANFIKACKTTSAGKIVEGRHHVYRFSATSPEEKRQWIEAIRKSNMLSPFYSFGLIRREYNQGIPGNPSF